MNSIELEVVKHCHAFLYSMMFVAKRAAVVSSVSASEDDSSSVSSSDDSRDDDQVHQLINDFDKEEDDWERLSQAVPRYELNVEESHGKVEYAVILAVYCVVYTGWPKSL